MRITNPRGKKQGRARLRVRSTADIREHERNVGVDGYALQVELLAVDVRQARGTYKIARKRHADGAANFEAQGWLVSMQRAEASAIAAYLDALATYFERAERARKAARR